MGSHSCTAIELWKFIQYTKFFPITSTLSEKEKIKHDQRLQEVLYSWKFSKINVPEDGICFFTSVALELNYFSKETIAQ